MIDVSRAAALLRGADDVLILTHRRPDGDTVGSAAALCLALRQLGKTAYLMPNEDATPIFHPYFEGGLAPADVVPGFVVTVDTAADTMLPESAKPYRGRVDLVIDHHGSNRGYGKANCIDAASAACGELVYRVILAMGVTLTAEIAHLLYIAVATDTGCFIYANTTADTHRIAAVLIDAGADFATANKRHFRSKSMKRLRLESLLLDEMHLYHDGLVAIAPISLALLSGIEAGAEEVEDISAFVGQVDGVKISATIRETETGVCKVSLRAAPALLDAALACAEFGGGGHKGAAGCTITAPLDEAERAVLSAIERHMTE